MHTFQVQQDCLNTAFLSFLISHLFVLYFFRFFAATQLALHLYQERTQVVLFVSFFLCLFVTLFIFKTLCSVQFIPIYFLMSSGFTGPFFFLVLNPHS